MQCYYVWIIIDKVTYVMIKNTSILHDIWFQSVEDYVEGLKDFKSERVDLCKLFFKHRVEYFDKDINLFNQLMKYTSEGQFLIKSNDRLKMPEKEIEGFGFKSYDRSIVCTKFLVDDTNVPIIMEEECKH